MDQLKSQVKPFEMSKWEFKEAWEEVRANRGAPGVDGQSIDEFEKDLNGNLYKVWTGCHRVRIFHPRCVQLPFPSHTVRA